MNTKIVCVVLNYNDYETTNKFCKCCENYDIISKIVIVDNCSTDSSYDNLLKLKCSKIDVIQTDKNGGYGYGNNFGIKYIMNHYPDDYKYAMICNPDTFFSEDTIYKMTESFNEDDVAIVAPLTLNVEGNPQLPIAMKNSGCFEFFTFSSFVLNRIFKPIEYSEKYFNNKNWCYVDCVQGSLFMTRLDYFYSYAMYDENIFLFFEETTLGIRLKRNNLKTKLLLNTTYVHEHSISINKSINSEFKKRKIMLNSMYVLICDEYDISYIKKIIMKIWKNICLIENLFLLKFFNFMIRH